MHLSREVKGAWDEPANNETLKYLDIFMLYHFRICQRKIERLSLSYGDKARYSMVAESDSSEALMSLRVTLMEYDSDSGSPPLVKRRLYISTCPDCQALLTTTDSLLPLHCAKCQGKKHSFVNFQQMIADINLVPAKQTSMPLCEAMSFLKVIGHTVEIREYLTREIGINLPVESCFYFLDNQAVILISRSEPYILSTRLRHTVAQIQLKLQENGFCLFKSIFFLDQKKIAFGIDAVTKQPKGKVDTQLRYLERKIYTPAYLRMHPSQWKSFLSNTTLVPKLSPTDLAILEINPAFHQSFLPRNATAHTNAATRDHCRITPRTAMATSVVNPAQVFVTPAESWDIVRPGSGALGVLKQCSRRHQHNSHSQQQCQMHRNTLHTAKDTSQALPSTVAFEHLLQRKKSFNLSSRSATHIIARVLYFIHALRARVLARRSRGGTGRGGTATDMEAKWQCGITNCVMPCAEDLPIYTEGFVAPLLYATLVRGQVYSIPQYMNALRDMLHRMAAHGFTRSYLVLAASLTFLILCCMNSQCIETQKYASFQDSWCGLPVGIAQGSLHKPVTAKEGADFTIATFVILKGDTTWADTILTTVHKIIFHEGQPHTADALLAIAGVHVPQHKKRMATILAKCSRCRLARAAKHGKVAQIGINIPHPTDLISTFALLDTTCTSDFLSFYSQIHGLRYWIVTVLHHSLYCIISHVPSYSTHHMLLTLMKLAQQYNITSFHWDAASQALPIVNEISQMTHAGMAEFVGREPGGVMRRLLAQRPAGKLTIPAIKVQMHLPRRHKSAGMAERKLGLAKQFLKKLQMDKDADAFHFDYVLQCAAAQLNNMPTFQCKDNFIAPIHLRSLSAVKPTQEPHHLTPRHSTALDVITSARRWCAAAMLQHKMHLLATPASEAALSCGISAANITAGSVCIDLAYVREHHTLIGALCRVTHTHKSKKGCIVYNPQGRPKLARRMYEDLTYISGALKDDEQHLLQVFNLPQVCVDANQGCLPGIQLTVPKDIDIEDNATKGDKVAADTDIEDNADKGDKVDADTDIEDNVDKTDTAAAGQEQTHLPEHHPTTPSPNQLRRGHRRRKSPRKFDDFVIF